MNSILKSAFIATILISSLIGCEKIELTDYAAYAQKEIDLMNDFYANKYNQKFDSLLKLGVDTIDKRDSIGVLIIHRVIGDGEKVEYGKKVGFRFTSYQIHRDTLTNSNFPQLYSNGSNLTATDLIIYTSGSTSNTDISQGLDYAIHKMNKNGKATIILSSTISSSGLNEIWDIDIQYIGK